MLQHCTHVHVAKNTMYTSNRWVAETFGKNQYQHMQHQKSVCAIYANYEKQHQRNTFDNVKKH
jgi:hypothetical protein